MRNLILMTALLFAGACGHKKPPTTNATQSSTVKPDSAGDKDSKVDEATKDKDGDKDDKTDEAAAKK